MKRLFIILFVLVSTLVNGQSAEFKQMLTDEYKNTVPVIHPKQLYSKLMEGQSIYLLDTRKSVEFETSSLNNAIRVGFLGFSPKKVSQINKNDEIVVFCTVGVRSESVGDELQKSGYTNVKNLYGGIINWVNQGYPVYNQKGDNTQKVHVYSKPWGKWLTKGEAVY